MSFHCDTQPQAHPHTVARLTIEVVYDRNSTRLVELTDQLDAIVQNAYDNGLLTGNTDAEVVKLQHHVSFGIGDVSSL